MPNDQTCDAVKAFALVASSWPIVPAPVRVDEATFQTSAARVPKLERVLVPFDQTAAAIVDESDVEAVRTVASV